MSQPKREGRRVTLEEARRLCASERVIDILWRPEENLSEEEQYALIYGKEETNE